MNPATVTFQKALIRAGHMALAGWSKWLDSMTSLDTATGPQTAPVSNDPRCQDAALSTSEASQ